MFLHCDWKGNDCIRKLRCHCIQILPSDIYSVRTDNKWGSSYVELLTLVSLRFFVFYGISSQKGWVISDFAKCTAKYHNRHSSKSIWVIKLTFSQKDLLIGESFWENYRLVTPLLFELCLIMIFSPVANFGHHPLCTFC